MTRIAIAHTRIADAEDAGRALGADLRTELDGQAPHAVILFASPRYDYPALLSGIHETCTPENLIGCSSAGEFSGKHRADGSAVALAIHSDSLRFRVGLGRGIRNDYRAACRGAVASFAGLDSLVRGKAALVLLDALAGQSEQVVNELTTLTGGGYQFFGGGAGDDARFQQTHVFVGREACEDAVATLEILSEKPIGVGSAHGWQPDSAPMRVTAARGNLLESLNAIPALDVYEEYACSRALSFDRKAPLPFFLHHILGVKSGASHQLRAPLAAGGQGGIHCATEIPRDATVCLMAASTESSAAAAATATQLALAAMRGVPVAAGLFFDCVATRLRLGDRFDDELEALRRAFPDTPWLGCNTYGQVVRAAGQFNGFHNCTAVVCLLPD